jgi:hypothetical protein
MYQKNKKVLDGTIEKCHAPKIHSGEHMFRMVKDLKVVHENGKEEEVKRQRRQKRMHRRMRRIMVTKLQHCSKKDQYFETYHIGRT